jgi:SOS-response transcriptional repressor LexA
MKLSQSELARRLGVAHASINKWEHNVTAPRRDNLKRLAEELNASIAWLLYGDEKLREPTGNDSIPPLRVVGAMIPMVSVQHAALRDLTNPQSLVNTVVSVAGEAAAITLVDDSNGPAHPAGVVWVLSYDERPRPGDMVLGRHGQGLLPILGKYSVEASARGKARIITPQNPDWPAARSDLETVEIVAVMLAEIRPARR